MSRLTKRLWVLFAPMVLILSGLGVTPANATTWPPPAPTPFDACGTKQDRFLVPTDDQTDYYYNDELLGQGTWKLVTGSSSVTVVAKNWEHPDYTFPAMTFGTQANSTCTELLDTVTFTDITCNATTKGTRATIVLTNTDDSTDWYHTNPVIKLKRWDGGQSATVWPAFGQVLDGQSTTPVTGGDTPEGGGMNTFFLAPGTYSITVTTDENGDQPLTNKRLYIPSCGGVPLPPGDPRGGEIVAPPKPSLAKATVYSCNKRTNRDRVFLDNRKATRSTRFRVVFDPAKGSTQVTTKWVAAGKSVMLNSRKFKNGKIVGKVKYVAKPGTAARMTQRTSRC